MVVFDGKGGENPAEKSGENPVKRDLEGVF